MTAHEQHRILRVFNQIFLDYYQDARVQGPQYYKGWEHAFSMFERVLQHFETEEEPAAPDSQTIENAVSDDSQTADGAAVQHDPVNHPKWYCNGIETLDYILSKNMDFLTGQVCKYISRAGLKDPEKELQDLQKARFYLNRKIELLEQGTQNDPS